MAARKPKAAGKKTAPKKTAKSNDGKIFKELKVWDLPVTLTVEELETHSEELTGAMLKIIELNAEHKAASAKIKEKIQAQAAIVSKLTIIVHDRSEKREVECEAEFNYETNNVKVTRTDTKEVIEDRPLAEVEKQMHLGLKDGETSPETVGAAVDGTTAEPGTVTVETGKAGPGESESGVPDCPTCEGFCMQPDGVTECETCGGTGKDPNAETTGE